MQVEKGLPGRPAAFRDRQLGGEPRVSLARLPLDVLKNSPE
jgi:hypothetical protein